MSSSRAKTWVAASLLLVPAPQSLRHVDANTPIVHSGWGEHRASSWPEGADLVVEAAGLGRPWINYSDGRSLEVGYPRVANPGQPISLTSTDLDEDGVRDLVVGYHTSAGGRLGLLRGNIDALYPGAREASERKERGEFSRAPFLSPGLTVDIGVSPDFVGTGHFDADGHLDLVVAASGGNALHWLLGSGDGGFLSSQVTVLPGRVSAMAVDDVNRRDGIADVMVAVTGDSASALVVFEGPRGAMLAEPEWIPLPAPASDLASGYLDDHYARDLVAATGDSLTIVYGRDRKLSQASKARATVGPARTSGIALESPAHSVAAGDFRWEEEYRIEIAVLAEDGSVRVYERDTEEQEAGGSPVESWSPSWEYEAPPLERDAPSSLLVPARISSLPTEGLVLVDRTEARIHLLTTDERGSAEAGRARSDELATLGRPVKLDLPGTPTTVMPGRFGIDAFSDLIVLMEGERFPVFLESRANGSIVVDDLGSDSDCLPDDGICAVGPLVIDPKDPKDPGVCVGGCTLQAALEHSNIQTGLDIITFAVSGSTSLSGSFNGPVVVDGAPSSPPPLDIEIAGAVNLVGGSSTVRGLATHFGAALASDNNIIEGCYLGTDNTGTIFRDNLRVLISDFASGNLIGGTTDAARNIIAGSWASIFVFGPSNTIIGNYLGTDVTGTEALSGRDQGDGVGIFDPSTTLGGPLPLHRGNLISGNFLGVNSDSGGLVQSNLIGPSFDGTLPIGNSIGVWADGAASLTVGGTMENLRNVISGNAGGGVDLTGSLGSLVQGNYVGMAANGLDPLPNGHGVTGTEASSSTIGGSTPGSGNLISGNSGAGVSFFDEASSSTIQGNLIGTDKYGTAAVPNVWGIRLVGGDFQIGGQSPLEGNLVSGNTWEGVVLEDTTGAVVEGNFVGTDITGGMPLGNGTHGLQILGGGSHTIGGAGDAGNVIFSNAEAGIDVVGSEMNVIQGNFVSDNLSHGVVLTDSSENVLDGNFIGTDITGDVAMGNAGSGLWILRGGSNTIGGSTGNLISANLVTGITVTDSGMNVIQGNMIGTDSSGEANLGNGDGIALLASLGNTVGGMAAGEGNIIAGNMAGVLLVASAGDEIVSNSIFENESGGILTVGSQVEIRENSIFDNGGLGIDHGANGVTPNDSDESDGIQNYPTLGQTDTSLEVQLRSSPGSSFVVEIFDNTEIDPSGHGEGETLLVSLQMNTDANGSAAASVALSPGNYTATATSSTGSTSEFSAEPGSGNIFDPDPLSSSGATYGDPGYSDPGGNDADTPELNAELMPGALLEIDLNNGIYTLAGSFAEVQDFEEPFNGIFGQTSPIFIFNRFDDGFEAVNGYYHIDTYMRYLNEILGLTVGPYQYVGGVRFDPHGLNGDDASNYDAATGRLAFGEGGVDDAEDADVIVHELGHGVHDWVTAGGLSQVTGLSEGVGDYFAQSYSRSFGQWSPSDPEYHWVFNWDGHNEFWPGRITNYPNIYPDLTGDIHTDGQIWSTCNMRIWDAIGRAKTDTAMVEGLRMTGNTTDQAGAAQACLQAAFQMGYSPDELNTMQAIYSSCGYQVVGPSLIFADGFESGDTSAWSQTVPKTPFGEPNTESGSREELQ